MTTDIEQIKKKIIYRSNYRGTKEMDKLLGAFTRKYLDELNMMKKIVDTDIDYFFKLYTRSEDGIARGHLSNDGNKKIAEFISNEYINKN